MWCLFCFTAAELPGYQTFRWGPQQQSEPGKGKWFLIIFISCLALSWQNFTLFFTAFHATQGDTQCKQLLIIFYFSQNFCAFRHWLYLKGSVNYVSHTKDLSTLRKVELNANLLKAGSGILKNCPTHVPAPFLQWLSMTIWLICPFPPIVEYKHLIDMQLSNGKCWSDKW